MAIIQQDISFLDLFGNEMRGMVSLPRLSIRDFATVYDCSVKKFSHSIKKITFWKLVGFISGLSREEAEKVRLQFRRPLTISIRVADVQGRDAKVYLVLDDLTAPGPITDRMLRDVIARTKCGNLTVENGAMVGCVKLPFEVQLFPARRPGFRTEEWKAPDSGIDHEIEFLKRGLHRVR